MQAAEASTSSHQQSASGTDKTSSSGDQHEGGNTYVNESEDDARRVPEMAFGGGQTVNSVTVKTQNNIISNPQQQGESSRGQRKRSRTPADKEHKRLRRLLRNRVSAQHARERKKAYVTELETKTKELENRNSELEERVSTLQNENFMLRQILKNTTAKRKGSGLTEASSKLEHGV